MISGFSQTLYWIAFILVLIASLNFGVVGITHFTGRPMNPLLSLLSGFPQGTNIYNGILVLVGISGVVALVTGAQNNFMCK